MDQLQEMMLAGEIEMDESMYGGHRKSKQRWGFDLAAASLDL
ncbi:MAG: hypothetical protein ACFFCW_44535 [Candidatus Hodarchaeota archaeon]